mmetsp:Transcript_33042/g.71425  ORF Transcript_33042/g.71425 Transcript_33042/m.71425 type:complete len:159 (-) Transcript_33042:181-657(-)
MDNRRQGTLHFSCAVDSLLHGLAGYFESTLWPESQGGDGGESSGSTDSGSRSGSDRDRNSRDGRGLEGRDRDGKDMGATESDAVMLSIEPRSHTPGMYSWFPLFLPLQQPVFVRKGETIVFHVWRCCDARKVWYEWCLGGPLHTPMQNTGGRHYSVGL